MRPSLRFLATAALLAATATPSALHGQSVPGALRVQGVGEPVTVNAARHHGYAAYPAWTLRALGARVDATPAGTRVVFGADSLEFLAGSPFFTIGDRTGQLVHPAYREGGVFYLPHQLFAQWFPTAFPDRVAHSDGVLHLAGTQTTTAATPTPAAASRPAADGEASRPLGSPAAAPIIVLDPGHGGVDPGRIGPSGLREKDVVLQVSKRLARILAERGYDVRMTRTTDTLINLYERGPMANEWRGARPGLFLSIHANGVTDPRANGYETFFLSAARTDDERRVAEMENAAVEYEENGGAVGGDDLQFIRNGLRNEFYILASNTLAGLIQDEFDEFHRGADRGVKQGALVVLIGAFMPAVLIELAFISNPGEERLLGSGTFQVDAAEGIADAVDRFFEGHSQWTGSTP